MNLNGLNSSSATTTSIGGTSGIATAMNAAVRVCAVNPSDGTYSCVSSTTISIGSCPAVQTFNTAFSNININTTTVTPGSTISVNFTFTGGVANLGANEYFDFDGYIANFSNFHTGRPSYAMSPTYGSALGTNYTGFINPVPVAAAGKHYRFTFRTVLQMLVPSLMSQHQVEQYASRTQQQ